MQQSYTRIYEWVLSTLASVVSIVGAVAIWRTQLEQAHGDSLWPMPALVLIQVVILGLIGFLGTAMDSENSARLWGILPWIASGGLLALGGLGTYGISILALMVLPAIAFFAASILADRRRSRQVLNDMSLLAISVIVNFALLFVFITI